MTEWTQITSLVNLEVDNLIELVGKFDDGCFVWRGLRLCDIGEIKVESSPKTLQEASIFFEKTSVKQNRSPCFWLIWGKRL
jgi:hypothetical protein